MVIQNKENTKNENNTNVDNKIASSTNNLNTNFSNMNEEDKIDYAVSFMQEYELLLNLYGKALGYTVKPYENIKINSIALTEYEGNKYVLADFTVIAKEKESIFRYGIQTNPRMMEADIELFFKDIKSFKQQKYDNYINIQNTNKNSIIKLDINKVQEKFSKEHPAIDFVMYNIMKYKKIINVTDFDNLNTNEYIFVGVQPIATNDMLYYYGNFKKNDDYIYEFPISASSLGNGLIPNGIYQLKKIGKAYACEYSRYSKKSSILDNLKNIDENNVYVFSNTSVNDYITISFTQDTTNRAAGNICSKYGEIIGDIIYDDKNKVWNCKIKVETTKKDYVLKELSNIEWVSNIKIED